MTQRALPKARRTNTLRCSAIKPASPFVQLPLQFSNVFVTLPDEHSHHITHTTDPTSHHTHTPAHLVTPQYMCSEPSPCERACVCPAVGALCSLCAGRAIFWFLLFSSLHSVLHSRSACAFVRALPHGPSATRHHLSHAATSREVAHAASSRLTPPTTPAGPAATAPPAPAPTAAQVLGAERLELAGDGARPLHLQRRVLDSRHLRT